MTRQLDMLICIVPKINPDAPTVGPAVLKSHLMAAGFSCEVVDLNVKLFNALKAKQEHRRYYFDNDELFKTHHSRIELNDDFKAFYADYEYVFLEWIELFKQKNPRWIGLSILSIYSQSVAVQLSRLIREHMPETKIAWGGAQIEHGIDKFKALGLMDHYVCGDGEFSIVDLVKGNLTANGIDSLKPNQVKDLNQMLLPNYDDINWEEYPRIDYQGGLVYITGSRGCVKRCTFCNVYEIWPEYRFRSGKNIANEIVMVKQKYERNFFKFTDSLINGSMKAYREMLHELVEYRKIDPDIEWSSQWIIRTKTQSPEEDYRMMKEAGCVELDIGVESFSESVRWHMGKKFTNDDMWWCFDMLQKYKIPYGLLMIVGYPTETEADHQITLDTIRRLYEEGYADATNESGNKLLHLSFGNTLMLSDNMPLWEQIKDDLTYYDDMLNWDYKGNDMITRLRRFKEVHDLIHELSGEKNMSWMHRKALRMYEEALEEQARKNEDTSG